MTGFDNSEFGAYTTTIEWGFGTDIPIAADFDGDGKTAVAIYRPSNGTWYILRSRDGFVATQWGTGTDIPIVGSPRR